MTGSPPRGKSASAQQVRATSDRVLLDWDPFTGVALVIAFRSREPFEHVHNHMHSNTGLRNHNFEWRACVPDVLFIVVLSRSQFCFSMVSLEREREVERERERNLDNRLCWMRGAPEFNTNPWPKGKQTLSISSLLLMEANVRGPPGNAISKCETVFRTSSSGGSFLFVAQLLPSFYLKCLVL